MSPLDVMHYAMRLALEGGQWRSAAQIVERPLCGVAGSDTERRFGSGCRLTGCGCSANAINFRVRTIASTLVSLRFVIIDFAAIDRRLDARVC
jgi:hypothetical protein